MAKHTFEKEIYGGIPDRVALAGGWIDQPRVSKFNPDPPGSMVVVSLENRYRFMLRCGMATSTKKVIWKLWGDKIPEDKDYAELVKELYEAENRGNPEFPAGSQDMVGLIYPGIIRIDYDFNHEGGLFPVHVEYNTDPEIAQWFEDHFYIFPVTQRPDGYHTAGKENMDPEWIRKLGQTGKDCFDGIIQKDVNKLGKAMNDCMEAWEAIFPYTVSHPTLDKAGVDLKGILKYYQSHYAGAMYSGSGGGYIYIVSEKPIFGAMKVKVRLK